VTLQKPVHIVVHFDLASHDLLLRFTLMSDTGRFLADSKFARQWASWSTLPLMNPGTAAPGGTNFAALGCAARDPIRPP